jgi:hypothetical protein
VQIDLKESEATLLAAVGESKKAWLKQ